MALTPKQKALLMQLRNHPAGFLKLIGFDRLTELHDEWMIDMIYGVDDETLQSHRGSYKTTCVSGSLALITLLMPGVKTMFNRKTDEDVKEVIRQVKMILTNEKTQYISKILYGTPVKIISSDATSLTTNYSVNDPRGTQQLLGMGTKGSITGKHFDRIFTDDIVNVQDRISRAERERTKMFYQELQNIKNRGGRIFNTGTPWHEDDAFKIMPEPKVYDCYSTGLISTEDLESIKSKMTASLFAANYEMRHIASDDVIFKNPVTGADASLAEQGEAHIDASYGGSDYTAFTICRKKDGKYYVFGKLWSKHVDDCESEIIAYRQKFNAGLISCEDNADKGYLKKQLRARGEMVHGYHETMNKFIKITSYLKSEWANVVFVDGTDDEYIKMICDYNIDADHDDAPDSLASIIRKLWGKKEQPEKDRYLLYL